MNDHPDKPDDRAPPDLPTAFAPLPTPEELRDNPLVTEADCCGNCRFFRPDGRTNPKDESKIGHCHVGRPENILVRLNPEVLPDGRMTGAFIGINDSMFPFTSSSRWCGDHEAKPRFGLRDLTTDSATVGES